MEDIKGYEIELQYFKQGGKYYSEGSYVTNKNHMFEISEEIEKMRKECNLPGINGKDWIVCVNADKHPNGYPMLILLDSQDKIKIEEGY